MSDEESLDVQEKKKESESVDALSADEISRRKSCTLPCEIYKDYQHIKFNAPILGSIGEFCAAFYHVPETNNIPNKCCLDEGNCKVGHTLPKSVAALVKYEIGDGKDIIVRYSNHYIKKATKHAEEFLRDDIKNQTASSSVSERTLKRITMYITSQPCHFSTKNTPKKSCCDVLLELLEDPRLKGVKIFIKPTHIFKAGRDKEASELVENGKEGIKKLWMAKGINITRMEEADWNFLYDLVDMNDDQRRRIIPPYLKSSREALDMEIGLEYPSDSSGSSGQDPDGDNSGSGKKSSAKRMSRNNQKQKII